MTRLGIGVVGAGRVGAVLGSALRAAGHPVVGVSAVSEASRDRADALLPGVPVLDVPEVVRRAELVVLAVPDDALPDLVAGLASTGAWQAGQIVVHTAGRYGAAVLDPARAQGVIPIALHPAMTFTGTSLDLSRLVGCSFAVTAPTPVLPIGQALVVEMGGEPVVVDEAARPLYHAALAHGANHLVVLVAQAGQALAAAGVADPGAVLRPLLTAALDGALRAESAGGGRDAGGDVTNGAVTTLTGPVRRGDAGTVRDHLDVLTGLGVRTGATDVAASYRALSRAATGRALAAGLLRAEQGRALLDVLATGDPAGEAGDDPGGAAPGAGVGPGPAHAPGPDGSTVHGAHDDEGAGGIDPPGADQEDQA
ncbi:Rossmann-like and DUF2520 domain-containing protein [Cellulomonas pakistanensis]|uniref:Oxidoreductase n=1 Tax=Cellulomonas pakistanensis TaxID=992287 RepID=A0A919U1X4_9CELL|nr:DUF2520 domain-containing protein [Cellulomonas pakistanensis]GIG35393.1 oxidoreductase [Cellulomonas pakistanensis]